MQVFAVAKHEDSHSGNSIDRWSLKHKTGSSSVLTESQTELPFHIKPLLECIWCFTSIFPIIMEYVTTKLIEHKRSI